MELTTALAIYLVGVVFLVWVCMLSDPSSDTLGECWYLCSVPAPPLPLMASCHAPMLGNQGGG